MRPVTNDDTVNDPNAIQSRYEHLLVPIAIASATIYVPSSVAHILVAAYLKRFALCGVDT